MNYLKPAIVICIIVLCSGCNSSDTTNNSTTVTENVIQKDTFDVGIESASFDPFTINAPNEPGITVYHSRWPAGYNPELTGTIIVKNFDTRRFNGQISINIFSVNVWGAQPIYHYVDLQPNETVSISFETILNLGGNYMENAYIDDLNYAVINVSSSYSNYNEGRYDLDLDNNVYSDSYVLAPIGPG